MTKTKLETSIARSDSKHMKHINRLIIRIEKYKSAISDRNTMIKKYESLVQYLLKENKVTKLELSKYVTKKNDKI